MAETTGIEWADHINPNPCGRTLGAYKSAARKIGCTVEEWMANRLSGQKWCFRCRTWKHHAEFSLDGNRRAGVSASCKECTSSASTASRYGMTRAELKEFRVAAAACEICGKTGRLVVDHNHETGAVRGHLCSACNNGLGMFRDDPELMKKAIAYLGAAA